MKKFQFFPKLAEMARKLVGNNFWIFYPPPEFFLVTMKKIKVVPNSPKWRENNSEIISGFFDPPPKKNVVNMKKIKVVPNWLKWRENWSAISSGFVDPPPQKN